MQFVSAQFAKCSCHLARARVCIRFRFRSYICKLCMRDFESVQCILQTAKVGQIAHNSQISKFLSLEHNACDAIKLSSSDAHRDHVWAFKWARHQQACFYCISAVSHHGLESSALNMVYLLPSSHQFAIIMVINCGCYCKCCPRKWLPGSRCWVTETTFGKVSSNCDGSSGNRRGDSSSSSSLDVLYGQCMSRAIWTRRFTIWQRWLYMTGGRTVRCVPWPSRSTHWRWPRHICPVRLWNRSVGNQHWCGNDIWVKG